MNWQLKSDPVVNFYRVRFQLLVSNLLVSSEIYPRV